VTTESLARDLSRERPPRVSLRRRLRRNLRGYVFVLPWIISLLVFTAYPMLASFYFSMTDYSVLKPPVWTGLQNFKVMFTQDPLYWKSAYNSAYYTLLSVPLQLVIALVLAMMLNRKARGIGIYRTIYYLPSLMPVVAGTLLWMLLLNPRDGLINEALSFVGLPKLGWLQSSAWSKPALVLMALWGSGWLMLIFLAALKDVPESLHEAAMIDGANSWQRFWAVTLPLLTPSIFFNLIMSIIGSFQVFAQALIAGGTGNSSGPLNSLLMYMVQLYRYAFLYFEMGYASAMALVLFLVLVAITLVVVKTSGSWVYYESARR